MEGTRRRRVRELGREKLGRYDGRRRDFRVLSGSKLECLMSEDLCVDPS